MYVSYCFALVHTMPAFSLFYSAFCLFSRSFPPHLIQFAHLEQNAEYNGMTQKQGNEAICLKKYAEEILYQSFFKYLNIIDRHLSI